MKRGLQTRDAEIDLGAILGALGGRRLGSHALDDIFDREAT